MTSLTPSRSARDDKVGLLVTPYFALARLFSERIRELRGHADARHRAPKLQPESVITDSSQTSAWVKVVFCNYRGPPSCNYRKVKSGCVSESVITDLLRGSRNYRTLFFVGNRRVGCGMGRGLRNYGDPGGVAVMAGCHLYSLDFPNGKRSVRQKRDAHLGTRGPMKVGCSVCEPYGGPKGYIAILRPRPLDELALPPDERPPAPIVWVRCEVCNHEEEAPSRKAG
jgi:hypothetical protein